MSDICCISRLHFGGLIFQNFIGKYTKPVFGLFENGFLSREILLDVLIVKTLGLYIQPLRVFYFRSH